MAAHAFDAIIEAMPTDELAEVVEDERRGDAGLGSDLAHSHRVRATLGEEPQRGIPDGGAGGKVAGIDHCTHVQYTKQVVSRPSSEEP